ncbi:MAG: TonB family protein [Acidobacteria bacterium]|nr:TonB family protein [Acidobacteriota bacterium]
MSQVFVRLFRSLALAALLSFSLIPNAHAQNDQKSPKTPRRLLVNIKPDYPLPMRNAHIGGMVRMNVTVSPAGNVTKIELIGGNAVFSESAVKAVMKWKYAPAATETTDELQFRFNPDSPNSR